MDRLDEFMQRKFAKDNPENRFVFHEEYWLQAQALIEAAERRKRRRLFWWWTSGALGVLILAGLAWWTLTMPAAAPEPALTATGAEAQQAMPAPLQPEQPSLHPSGTAPADRLLSPSEIARPEQEQTQKEPAPGRERQNAFSTDVPKTPGKGLRIGQSGSTLPLETSINQPGQDGDQQPPPTPDISAKPEQTVVSSGTPFTVPLLHDGSTGDKPAALSSTSSAAPDPLSLPLIPLPIAISTLQTSNFKLQTSNFEFPTPTIRHRDWRYQMGLTVAVATPTGYLSDEKPGFAFGLSNGLRREGSPLSFHAGVLWRRWQGTLADTTQLIVSNEIGYNFGYVLDRTQTRVRALNWLEIPLYAQLHWRRFGVSAGAAPAILLSVRGREEQTHSTTLMPDPMLIDSKNIRMDNYSFKKSAYSALLGLDWQATNRLSIGLLLRYQPGAVQRPPNDISSHYVPPPGQSWWGELRLNYALFNAK